MNWRVIKRLLVYPARYKWRIFFLVFSSLFGVILLVAQPLPIKIVIDNVLIGDELSGIYYRFFALFKPFGRFDLLWISVSLLGLISIASSILNYLTVVYTTKLGMRLVYDLSIDIYAKLQQLSVSFYNKNKLGDIIQRFTGDALAVYLLAAQITLPVITSLFTFFAMFYIMVLIDLQLALIALSVIPILGIVLFLFRNKLNDTTERQYQTQGALTAYLHQSLTSMKMIQAFVRENFMFKKMQDYVLNYENAYLKAIMAGESYKQLITLITGLTSAALVGLGAYKGMNGNVTAGELYIFLGYLASLYGPVNLLATAVGTAVSIGARGKRVLDILDSPEIVVEKKDALSLDKTEGRIEFQNVDFGYSSNSVLKNISLEAPAGKTIAIIGPTGAGKTTLISLLSRFHDPTKGSIKLDGVDLSEYKLHDLRESISLVLQEPFLFPMTIAENVAFGNPEASMKEIVDACIAAEAHSFIEELPDGYDTMLSEAGSTLSGGEKQRICLARAFLKESQILILDEPTSALDALTEGRIFKRMAGFTKGKTVILISHRLSTVKHADVIYILKNGKIMEQGGHSELLKAGGLYAELYEHQNI